MKKHLAILMTLCLMCASCAAMADMEPPEEGARPNAVGDEAWELATTPPTVSLDGAFSLFTNELTGEDKLSARPVVDPLPV